MNLETTFTISYSKNNLEINNKILNLVYLPILGQDSYSLYTLLNSQKNLKDLNFAFLKNIYGLKISNIKNSLKKLEAMSLVRTFYNKDDNEIVFNINEPLNFKNFFDNKKFKKIFLKKASKKYFEALSSEFIDYSDIEIKVKNFRNISEKFKYKIFSDDYDDNDLIIDNNILSVDIDNNEKQNSDKVLIKKNESVSIDSPSTINIISNENNIVNDNKISFDHNHISYFGNYDNNKSFLVFIEEKLKQIKNPPEKYFKEIKKNDLNQYEIELISKGVLKYKLSFEVVNCLMEYIYITNNKIIMDNYFSKIASSFVDHNINNAADAILYLEKAFIYSKGLQIKINQNKNLDNDEFDINKMNEFDVGYNPEIKNDPDFDQKIREAFLSL